MFELSPAPSPHNSQLSPEISQASSASRSLKINVRVQSKASSAFNYGPKALGFDYKPAYGCFYLELQSQMVTKTQLVPINQCVVYSVLVKSDGKDAASQYVRENKEDITACSII